MPVVAAIGRLELWSDTRFVDAHRLDARLGYRRLPGTRDLHDRSNSTEYHYAKSL
jgi:putative acetyltransferase